MACRSQAFSLFRQCSAARTTAVARHSSSSASSSVRLVLRSGAAARCRPYSTESSGKNGEGEKAPDPEKKEDDSSRTENGKEGENGKETECEKKLKAKEDEVTDLTVRTISFYTSKYS